MSESKDIASVEEVVRQLDAVFLPHEADRLVRESAIALLSALEKDATRYAWLRGDPLRPPNNPFEVLQWNDGGPAALHGIELDTAIDLARGQS